jgi:hypothetical protein
MPIVNWRIKDAKATDGHFGMLDSNLGTSSVFRLLLGLFYPILPVLPSQNLSSSAATISEFYSGSPPDPSPGYDTDGRSIS